MAIDPVRRRLLHCLPALALAGAAPPVPVLAAGMPAAGLPDLLTSWRDRPRMASRFFAGMLSAPGSALRLPARGHALAWHPARDGSALVVGRRPGDFLWRWQVSTGTLRARFDADDSFRFEGHFALDPAGRCLYATESDLVAGHGQIGVYDLATLERLAVWPSGGIGPHGVRVLADGRLAVANGGILTLPETGRMKWGLAQMDPSLALLDPADGRLLAHYRLPDRFMSVRHLAEAPDGRLAVALQNEGGPPRPLFARLHADALVYGEADAQTLAACGGYAGDIACDGRHFAVSCGPAGVTAVWRLDGRLVGTLPTAEVCALSVHAGQVLATGDQGLIWRLGLAGARILETRRFEGALDNHAVPA